MEKEKEFQELIAQYCEITPDRLTPDLRFREDLHFSSLDFMAFLGDLEDTFDVELDETEILQIRTLGEATSYLKKLSAE